MPILIFISNLYSKQLLIAHRKEKHTILHSQAPPHFISPQPTLPHRTAPHRMKSPQYIIKNLAYEVNQKREYDNHLKKLSVISKQQVSIEGKYSHVVAQMEKHHKMHQTAIKFKQQEKNRELHQKNYKIIMDLINLQQKKMETTSQINAGDNLQAHPSQQSQQLSRQQPALDQ